MSIVNSTTNRARKFIRENPTARRIAHKTIKKAAHFIAYRKFDAANPRRFPGWHAPSGNPNADTQMSLARLRDLSRDLYTNNTHAHKGINCLTNNVVGTGLVPIPQTDAADTDKQIAKLWKDWSKRPAADNIKTSTYAMQHQAAHSLFTDGEIFARKRPRKMSDGLAVPFQVEHIESDICDHTKNKKNKDGSLIISGVNMDKIKRVDGYHFLKDHPANNGFFGSFLTESEFCPAKDVAHLFIQERPGQRRGIPWMVAAIAPLKNLDDYGEAERIRKKLEASFTAFVTGGESSDTDTEKSITDPALDADGKVVDTVEPGLIAYLNGDRQVTMNNPKGVGGYEEYNRVELRNIAAGFLISYELLTGDLSGTNYSSIRAGLIEFYRLIKTLQLFYFIPMYCETIWDWFIEEAYAVGLIDTDKVTAKWTLPRATALDRNKEAVADLNELKAGTRTLYDIIAEKGGDPAEVVAEFVKINEELEKQNISFIWQDKRAEEKTETKNA